MDVRIVEPIFAAIDKGLNGTLTTGVTTFMAAIGVVVGSLWVLNIAIRSLWWYFNGISAAIREMLEEMFKVVFITFFAIGLQPYISVVVPVVTNAPGELSQLLTGTTNGSSTNQVDGLINAFIQTAIELGSLKFDLFTSEFSAMFAATACFILFLLGGFAFLGTCVVTLVVLKIATTLFLAIGPLFILLALFTQTRQYFWGWVNLMGGFMLTNLLFSVVVSLEISYIRSSILSSDGLMKADWVSVLSMPLVFGAFTAIANLLPSWAASVMSGAPVGNAGGISSMLGSNLGGIRTGMNAARGVKNGIQKAKSFAGNRIGG